MDINSNTVVLICVLGGLVHFLVGYRVAQLWVVRARGESLQLSNWKVILTILGGVVSVIVLAMYIILAMTCFAAILCLPWDQNDTNF